MLIRTYKPPLHSLGLNHSYPHTNMSWKLKLSNNGFERNPPRYRLHWNKNKSVLLGWGGGCCHWTVWQDINATWPDSYEWVQFLRCVLGDKLCKLFTVMLVPDLSGQQLPSSNSEKSYEELSHTWPILTQEMVDGEKVVGTLVGKWPCPARIPFTVGATRKFIANMCSGNAEDQC